mmetsp:Transcript_118521/g.335262  ORF Transcript_118521/g.335262 Transcript_118521/m.335262 type:complete len:124 (-) Transcript_118521:51-422(-)
MAASTSKGASAFAAISSFASLLQKASRSLRVDAFSALVPAADADEEDRAATRMAPLRPAGKNDDFSDDGVAAIRGAVNIPACRCCRAGFHAWRPPVEMSADLAARRQLPALVTDRIVAKERKG